MYRSPYLNGFGKYRSNFLSRTGLVPMAIRKMNMHPIRNAIILKKRFIRIENK